MKYSYKKLNFILILTFSTFLVFGQIPGNQLKGTIRTNGTPGQIDVYFTPDFTNTTDYFDNINLAFAIPMGQASTSTVASIVSSQIASIPVGTAWAQQTPGTVNSERIFTFVGNNTATTVSSFTATQEFKLCTVAFNDATMNMASVKLVDLTSTGGGPTLQSFLYISMGTAGQVSNSTSANKFYPGSGGTVGNSGTDYFVTANTQIVLPVTLVSFTAAKDGTGVNLKWLVSSETNAKGYDVERSSGNGAAFTSIAHVAANNTGKYSSIDASPLGGVNYYRLKMIDNDGKFKYSEVRSVLFDGTTVLFDIYPNPVVTNTLYLHLQQYNYQGNAKAIITDIAGRSIQTTNIVLIKGNNQLPVTVKTLTSGTYFITVYDAGGAVITESKKLVKS